MEGRRRRWARPQAGAPPWTAPRGREEESGDLFAPVISGLPVATGTAQ